MTNNTNTYKSYFTNKKYEKRRCKGKSNYFNKQGSSTKIRRFLFKNKTRKIKSVSSNRKSDFGFFGEGKMSFDKTGNSIHEEEIPKDIVIDYITKKKLKLTEEERVRQRYERVLVEEYGYSKELMDIEFPIQRGSEGKKPERADIVIFNDSKKKTQDNIYIIIETKQPKKKDGLMQLKTYLTATTAEFGIWTNGTKEIIYLKKSNHPTDFKEIIDIPKFGQTLDLLEDIDYYTKNKLVPATDLKSIFERIHNYIYANQGFLKDKIFSEILKIIFIKTEDEKNVDEDICEFRITPKEYENISGREKARERCIKLFKKVKEEYEDVFTKGEELNLNSSVVGYIISQLQKYSLWETNIDVKGAAFETIVGSNLKGDRGEFFTPREVVKMIVEMLDPKPNESILDPACGSGGFLVVALNYVRDQITKKYSRFDKGKIAIQKREYAEKYLVGIDFNPDLAKVAKMNMVINEDGHGGIFCENSLLSNDNWGKDALNRLTYKKDNELKMDKFDIVITNPPFGSKGKIDDKDILALYELGHEWKKDKITNKWNKTKKIKKNQVPDILFIERCIQFLRDGGRLGIVLPEGVLGNSTEGYVREYILQKTNIIAVIDLPKETFQPETSTKTCVLILQKKKEESPTNNKIFMAIPNYVGHDRRGRPIYKKDKSENIILNNDLIDVIKDFKLFLEDEDVKF